MSRLVVVGDLLLDRDLRGHVERMAPDAPVPVVDEREVLERPGGAGLAALLAAGDGHDVTLVCATADDSPSDTAIRLLERAGVTVRGLPAGGSSPVKMRVSDQQGMVVRIDSGTPENPPERLTMEAAEAIGAADIVVAADHGRGTLGYPPLRDLLCEIAHSRHVVWDPHPRGAAPTCSTYTVTPNLSELSSFTSEDGVHEIGLAEKARALRVMWQVENVVVTAASGGAYLLDGVPDVVHFAPLAVAAGDTCGAGDRFATAMAGVLVEGAGIRSAVRRAVDAATAFVMTGGAGAMGWAADAEAPDETDAVRLAERTRSRGGTVVAVGGCFDILHAGHVQLLERARHFGDALVVLLNSDDSVRRLKGPERPVNGQEDRTSMLRSMRPVDAVMVFDQDTPERALGKLRPDVWVKGGDYDEMELPETPLVRSWGGRVEIVPLLRGRSTTRIRQESRHGG